jgi:hypothetical protein
MDIKTLLNTAKYAKRELIDNLLSEVDFKLHLRVNAPKETLLETKVLEQIQATQKMFSGLEERFDGLQTEMTILREEINNTK